MIINHKICCTCKNECIVTDFYKNARACKACSIAAAKKSALKNPEKRREHSRKWARNNRDKIKATYLKWKEQFPERVKAYNRLAAHRRRARMRKVGGTVRIREWFELLKQQGNKCLKCGSTENLTADHVIPISKGGLNLAENIQILCKHCNYTKHTDIVDYREASYGT